jgi:hypothetical protein
MRKFLTAIVLTLALFCPLPSSALAGLYDNDYSSDSYHRQQQQQQERDYAERQNRESDQRTQEHHRQQQEQYRQQQRDNEVRTYQRQDDRGSQLCQSTSTYTSCR